VFPVRCELGFYIQKESILHNHPHDNLKSHIFIVLIAVSEFVMKIMFLYLFSKEKLPSDCGLVCCYSVSVW
jgi:hypothetical protein